MKARLIAIGILIGMILEFAIIAINAPKNSITGKIVHKKLKLN